MFEKQRSLRKEIPVGIPGFLSQNNGITGSFCPWAISRSAQPQLLQDRVLVPSHHLRQ